MNFMLRAMETKAQRAVGRLALGFSYNGRTRIQKFYQEGCLKARLPRAVEDEVCEAITVNISGGIAGGDRLDTSIRLDEGTQVTVASQAAERVYRSLGASSRIAARIEVRAGARLDYLPQETILFDGFALERSLEIDLAGDAAFLGVESLVFGRQAMGEIVRSGFLRDRVTLRRDGKILLQDMTRLDGDIAARLERGGVARGAIAVSLIVSTDACKLDAVRAALDGAYAGASVIDGILVARVLAPSAISLRQSVVAALGACRDGRALPRTWQG